MKNFQDEFGQWADSTFLQSTEQTICAHFAREAVELVGIGTMMQAIANRVRKAQANGTYQDTFVGDAGPGEAADCYLLLLHLLHKQGFSLETSAMLKFAILKNRQWGEPDAQGVVEHIREEAAPDVPK